MVKKQCNTTTQLSDLIIASPSYLSLWLLEGSLSFSLSMYRGRVSPSGYYITFLVLLLYFVTCSAKNITLPHCDNPSSCGNILNISYPFRLKDDPKNCGDPNYELSCENNTTVLYLYSVKYYVQAINRNNNTIRVADAGVQKNDCSSLPLQSLTSSDLSYYTPSYYRSSAIIFVSCENPVNSSLYVNTSPCVNGVYTSKSSFPSLRKHSYVLLVDAYAEVSVVEDACSIDMIVMSSSPTICKVNCSYLDIHKELVSGFELSWSDIYCKQCNGSGYCRINQDYTEVLGCSYDDYPCGFWCHVIDDIAIATYYYLFYWRRLVADWPSYQDWLYYQESATGGHSRNKFYIVGTLRLGAYLVMTVIIAMSVVKFLCGAPCVVAFLIYKWRRRHLSMYDTVEDFLRSHNNLMPIRYSFSDIKKMTKGFRDKLGEGGYGSVYKGKLRSGRAVAIKILAKPKANGQEFINEVATIGRIHHVNVVQLIGFCAERSKRALVYEFMPNGSLEKYIFSKEENITLGCEKMFEISVGVARGIEYLHRGCDMQILHFDIKPHNILLDENFNPKVSDFGLAKLYPTENSIVSLTAARGTMGYMAPELFYKNIGGVSYKADVYSFGMLLMEMVGRRKNLNASVEHLSQIYFPSWVYDQYSEGKDIEMGDATDEERQVAKKMVMVALWCIQMKPSDRPSMNKVVQMLEGEVISIQMPPKPFLTPREMREEDAGIMPTPTSTDFTDSISLLENAN